jgi:hypothetical protein
MMRVVERLNGLLLIVTIRAIGLDRLAGARDVLAVVTAESA